MRYFMSVLLLAIVGFAQESPQIAALSALRPFSLPNASDPQDIPVKCATLARLGTVKELEYQVAADDTVAALPAAAHLCINLNLSKVKDPDLADSLDRTINVAVFSTSQYQYRYASENYAKLVGQYNQLVQSYNDLLSQYQVALAQANRRDRALAMWQAWQAAHPAPQTIQLNVCTNPFGCPK